MNRFAGLLGIALTGGLLALPVKAPALGPQECVILVNQHSLASKELANFYADLRGIPAINILHLDIPPRMTGAGAAITPEEFRTTILDPVMKLLRERQLTSHILVWLYSLDFPTTIATAPPMSLTGLTFTRGIAPEPDLVERGAWLSPLFRGPDSATGPASPPISLEQFTVPLTTNMPVPSMFLGWSGARGMTVEAIKRQLRTAAAADGTHPTAQVFFEVSGDVRTTARQWQFEPVTRELAPLGILATTEPGSPRQRPDRMGIMAGRPVLSPESFGTLRPGAYADHLTSFGALFHTPEQTKLTAWLEHGAAASSGTIAEPYANWAKFPSARFFVHYAAGSTMIEALYQSIRCPLQIIPVGDPLCSPWSKPPGITLIPMHDETPGEPLKGALEFMASAWGGFGQAPAITMFFLDGRPVHQPGNQATLQFDSARLSDGYHEIKTVAFARDLVRHQGSATVGFTIRNRGQGVTLGGYTQGQEVDLHRPLSFTFTAEGTPTEIAIVCQERVLARAPYTTNAILSVHPLQTGAGPVSFQAVAVYEGSIPVRSEPLRLNIRPLNQPPVITTVNVTTNNDDKKRTATMVASDPDGDDINVYWYTDLTRLPGAPTLHPATKGNTFNAEPNAWNLSTTGGIVTATITPDAPNRIREIRVELQVEGNGGITTTQQAGLVFNMLNPDTYIRWGLDGHRSAWVLTRIQDGNATIITSRGAPIQPGKTYTLTAAQITPQKMALLVDDDVIAVADLAFGPGDAGVFGGASGARFDHVLITPPSSVRSIFQENGTALELPNAGHPALPAIVAGARDQQKATIFPAFKTNPPQK